MAGRRSWCIRRAVRRRRRCAGFVPTLAITGRLRDTLRLTNGFAAAPEGLLPRLAHCFLVRDRAAAQNLAPQHPDCYFLLPDGVSYHGHAVSGGRKTGGGPLALKRELRELSATGGGSRSAKPTR